MGQPIISQPPGYGAFTSDQYLHSFDRTQLKTKFRFLTLCIDLRINMYFDRLIAQCVPPALFALFRVFVNVTELCGECIYELNGHV